MAVNGYTYTIPLPKKRVKDALGLLSEDQITAPGSGAKTAVPPGPVTETMLHVGDYISLALVEKLAAAVAQLTAMNAQLTTVNTNLAALVQVTKEKAI